MHAAAQSRIALIGLVLSATSFAHHGVAPHYDTSKPVKIEGIVSKFEFINPHSFVYIETLDAGGQKQIWNCEMASRSVLSRNGLRQDTFKPGDPITIDGVAARHNPTGCALRIAHFADGSVLDSTTLFAPTVASGRELPAERSLDHRHLDDEALRRLEIRRRAHRGGRARACGV